MSPMLLGRQIDGVWHTGIEVYGTEYFYDISQEYLRDLQRLPMIYLTGTATILQKVMQFLLSKSVPDYIQNQVQQVSETPLGRMLLPMLQQQQRAAQQAASLTGQRTLWTRGDTASVASSGGNTAGGTVAAETRVSAATVTAEEWPSSNSRIGKLLRNVCTSEELVHSSKRIFLMTLLTIINNLLRPEQDGNFRRLRATNPTLQGKVLRIPGGEEALRLLGFEREIDSDKTDENNGQCKGTSTQHSHAQTSEAMKNSQESSASNAGTPGDTSATQDFFVFKQFEKSSSEAQVVNQLKADKVEIEAFLAALDRKKQHTTGVTRTTGP